MSGRPTYRAYIVEDRDGTTPDEHSGYWTKIGAAWPHADGKGLNIVLSALPVTGRIVLREYVAEEHEPETAPAKKATRGK